MYIFCEFIEAILYLEKNLRYEFISSFLKIAAVISSVARGWGCWLMHLLFLTSHIFKQAADLSASQGIFKTLMKALSTLFCIHEIIEISLCCCDWEERVRHPSGPETTANLASLRITRKDAFHQASIMTYIYNLCRAFWCLNYHKQHLKMPSATHTDKRYIL